MSTGDGLLRAVRGCAAVEVVWPDAGGLRVRSEPAVVDHGSVVLLLTADAFRDAASLAAAHDVVVAATDARGAPPGWRPAAATASTRVEPLGTGWADGPLLPALVTRDPVARALVGSLLLRREHWWAVPRHLVRLHVTSVLAPPPPRGSSDVLVAALVGAEVRLLGVAATAEEEGAVLLAPRASLSPAPDGAAVLAVRTALPSLPGAERVEVLRGRLDGARIVDVQRSGRIDPAPDGLLSRWRGERALARACRTALRDWREPVDGG